MQRAAGGTAAGSGATRSAASSAVGTSPRVSRQASGAMPKSSGTMYVGAGAGIMGTNLQNQSTSGSHPATASFLQHRALAGGSAPVPTGSRSASQQSGQSRGMGGKLSAAAAEQFLNRPSLSAYRRGQ